MTSKTEKKETPKEALKPLEKGMFRFMIFGEPAPSKRKHPDSKKEVDCMLAKRIYVDAKNAAEAKEKAGFPVHRCYKLPAEKAE